MHNGRVRLRAVDATAADATTSQDTLDLEASWQDDQGNTFAVRCTRVIPGSFICPVYGGVATNRVLDGPPAPRPDCLPGGFAYLAFWGIGQTLENGQVLDSNIVIQGTLAEATPGQQNHPPLTDPLVAAGLRLHVLAGPAAVEQGRYMRRRIRTGCPAMNGQAVEYWHVTFDNLTVGTERTAPPVPKRTVRPSLAWRPTGPAQDVISTLTPSEGL
jgi:hypothetical protein